MFPGNKRKLVFQSDIFGKTIFSKHLEKEKMIFRAVLFIRGDSTVTIHPLMMHGFIQDQELAKRRAT